MSRSTYPGSSRLRSVSALHTDCSWVCLAVRRAEPTARTIRVSGIMNCHGCYIMAKRSRTQQA